MLFRRKPKKKKKGTIYRGEVAFVNGSHYPVGEDGQPITHQRLLWDSELEEYAWADDDDPTHQHLYEQRVVEMEA